MINNPVELFLKDMVLECNNIISKHKATITKLKKERYHILKEKKGIQDRLNKQIGMQKHFDPDCMHWRLNIIINTRKSKH